MATMAAILFYIYLYRETFKNLFVWNQKALAFDIWLHSFI